MCHQHVTLWDVDRKARQILIDTRNDKLLSASLAEIREKVCTTINAITNPPPPPRKLWCWRSANSEKADSQYSLKEKEIVDWLQDASIEFEFTLALAKDTTIMKHNFPILVPCIPLAFDPTEDGHLREVEECNELPTGTIVKARCIKPAYRRAPEQRSAHTIFALKDVVTANFCIRDGLYVCGFCIHPSWLKHKLLQCMKC
jgi:hypothetical protein